MEHGQAPEPAETRPGARDRCRRGAGRTGPPATRRRGGTGQGSAWEIHYIQKKIPWAEIDTVFMMLMEGQGFGRPQPQEGKNVGGPSVLPE